MEFYDHRRKKLYLLSDDGEALISRASTIFIGATIPLFYADERFWSWAEDNMNELSIQVEDRFRKPRFTATEEHIRTMLTGLAQNFEWRELDLGSGSKLYFGVYPAETIVILEPDELDYVRQQVKGDKKYRL
jgi:hypothetical protein